MSSSLLTSLDLSQIDNKKLYFYRAFFLVWTTVQPEIPPPRNLFPVATEEEPEDTCTYGTVSERVEHVLLHCLLTHNQRSQYLLANGQINLLRNLFDHSKHRLTLLHFLDET